MTAIVLDAGALSAAAAADRALRERIAQLARRTGEPLLVPTTVLIESTTGVPSRDARVNAFLKGCEVVPLTAAVARRAAALRFAARAGSAVDASVVATAESRGGGLVLTGALDELHALASQSPSVAAMRFP